MIAEKWLNEHPLIALVTIGHQRMQAPACDLWRKGRKTGQPRIGFGFAPRKQKPPRLAETEIDVARAADPQIVGVKRGQTFRLCVRGCVCMRRIDGRKKGCSQW